MEDYTWICCRCDKKYNTIEEPSKCDNCGSTDFIDKEINEMIESPNSELSPWAKAVIEKSEGVIRCPKCGSTAVETGARGFSIVTGFLGAGSTVNRCGHCGYKWKPKG